MISNPSIDVSVIHINRVVISISERARHYPHAAHRSNFGSQPRVIVLCCHVLYRHMAGLDEVVKCTGKVVNAEVEAYLDPNTPSKGAEAFQDFIVDLLLAKKLASNKTIDTRIVLVHPDNREGQGYVPFDVHKLLSRICPNGWSWSKVAALAAEIPPDAEGDRWRAFNAKLIASSDGLVAPLDTALAEYATSRGSHTTAAVNLMHYGCTGMFDCTMLNGVVSKSKIIEAQPSMAEPLKGITYVVLKWQIVKECPRLMEALARTGNASHGVERKTTALQGCSRIHHLFMAGGCADDSWPRVVQQACIGMPEEYHDTADQLAAFVKTQSGGKDGRVLHELVNFERTLKLKRDILPSDLMLMSKLNLPDAPRWVSAMVKTMLVSPLHSLDVCTLFSKSELANIGAKLRGGIVEAHALLLNGHAFVAREFMHPDVVVTTKVLSDFEIRLVMFTHGKPCRRGRPSSRSWRSRQTFTASSARL